MAFNPRDDPAVVTAERGARAAAPKEHKEQAPKKPAPPPIPVSAILAQNSAAEGEPVKLLTNWATNTAFATTDGKYVIVPRATAGLLPTASVPADDAIGRFETTAPVLIAVHHWVEKYAAAGATEQPSKFTLPVVHTEIAPIATEWEKDFLERLLTHDHATLFGVINFAEKNKLESLLEFCIVALSCELRGKSAEEMSVALCVQGDAITEEELERAAASYSWFQAATAPK